MTTCSIERIERAARADPWILLVEDDADLRVALHEVLEGMRLRVRSARDGRDALELLRSLQPPALVLLDLHMPVMDGWRFATETASERSRQGVPLLLLSDPWNLAKDRTLRIPGV